MSAPRVALVLNANARSVTPELILRLKQQDGGRDVFVSSSLSEATEIANRIVLQGYDTVLSGGGDGTFTITLTEVRNAAQRQGRPLPRFGVLRLGTGNAIAHVAAPAQVGPNSSDEELMALAHAKSTRKLRMVETEGYLTPFAGAGADAEILADYGRTRALLRGTPLEKASTGLAGYSLAALTQSLPKYLVRRMPIVRVVNLGTPGTRLDSQGRPMGEDIATGATIYEGPARIVAVATIPFFGFNFRMFPFADLRQDRMHLRISTVGSLGFAWNVKSIWRGTYFEKKTIFDFHVDHVGVHLTPAVDFQIGGDTHGKRSSFEARLSPEPIDLACY
jgi:diacylglycerol kinase family enzyme